MDIPKHIQNKFKNKNEGKRKFTELENKENEFVKNEKRKNFRLRQKNKKLDNELKKLTNTRDIIRYEDIVKLQDKYGKHVH